MLAHRRERSGSAPVSRIYCRVGVAIKQGRITAFLTIGTNKAVAGQRLATRGGDKDFPLGHQ